VKETYQIPDDIFAVFAGEHKSTEPGRNRLSLKAGGGGNKNG